MSVIGISNDDYDLLVKGHLVLETKGKSPVFVQIADRTQLLDSFSVTGDIDQKDNGCKLTLYNEEYDENDRACDSTIILSPDRIKSLIKMLGRFVKRS